MYGWMQLRANNIPNWILKDFSYILAAPIAAIYNSSLRQSYVPPSWKQADILPIPKVSQVTSLAKHLRPIALTPVLSKVLESFVVSWMRRATVHSETQFDSIKDSSTTLALITMLHHVLQRLERKNTYARILLIDFSKRLIILITTSSWTNLKQMEFPRYVWSGRRPS